MKDVIEAAQLVSNSDALWNVSRSATVRSDVASNNFYLHQAKKLVGCLLHKRLLYPR